MPINEVRKTNRKALVHATLLWPPCIHVGLHGHQQHGIKAFGVAIGGIHRHLRGSGAPRQGPGRIAAHQRRAPIGVYHVAPTRRHTPEAMPIKAVRRVVARHTRDGTRVPDQPSIGHTRNALPRPRAGGVGRGEAHFPGLATIPKGRATQDFSCTMRKINPDVNIRVAVDIGVGGSQCQLDLAPWLYGVHESIPHESHTFADVLIMPYYSEQTHTIPTHISCYAEDTHHKGEFT